MSRSFLIPTRIIYGENALSESVSYMKDFGKKAFIVTGQTVVTLNGFKALTALLTENGIQYTIFTGITDEPTDVMINEGLQIYQESACDFIIGIGGGSPLDSMKAIAALATNGGEIADYMGKEILKCTPKMVAIPTTAGTGSEATQFTVITDSKKDIKMLLKGACLVPDLAVIDGSLTESSPPKITASTGLDALTHAVESYTSRRAQPLTDALSISAIKRIFKYLPIAYNDGTNKVAREQMSIAALEAGISINNASVTVVHGMSRPIGALFHVPHGISNAMLLVNCMAFAIDGANDKFAELARAIGVADKFVDDKTAAEYFVDALADICHKCQVPTLETYGIDREKFMCAVDKMSGDAIASKSPANTMKEVTKEDIEMIYKSLWQ